MIIVEGPDGVGKTTVARAIQSEMWRRLGRCPTYRHMTKPIDNFDFYWGYEAQMERYSVQDRFHLGELAYGARCYPCRQNAINLKLIRARLQQLGAVVVVITAKSTWFDRYYVEKKEMFTKAQINEVAFAFIDQIWYEWPDIYFDTMHINSLKYPWPTGEFIKGVVDLWMARQIEVQSVLSRRHKSGVNTRIDIFSNLELFAALEIGSLICPAVRDMAAE